MTLGISVVIPARNAEATLHLAITSAVKAGCDDIVVVNDASEDDTYNVALKLAQTHLGKVRILWTGAIRAGVCHARNLGISHARHPLIVPLDADDTLLDESLDTFRRYYQPNRLVYSGWYEGVKDVAAPPPGMLNRKNVAYATWLFEKRMWQAVGGYAPAYNLGAEDYHFMVALVQAGVVPVRIEAPLYRRTVNIGTRTDTAKHLCNCWKSMLKDEFPDFIVFGSNYTNLDDF